MNPGLPPVHGMPDPKGGKPMRLETYKTALQNCVTHPLDKTAVQTRVLEIRFELRYFIQHAIQMSYNPGRKPCLNSYFAQQHDA
jgi:hypothetical protein